jgi:hypothetical protein
MYLVAIAWMYVVLMMAVAEALSTQGSLLGAFFTLLLYGVAPLSLVLYLMGTPLRRRARHGQDQDVAAAQGTEPAPDSGGRATGVNPQPDGGHHAARDPVTSIGKAAVGLADGTHAGLGDPPQAR